MQNDVVAPAAVEELADWEYELINGTGVPMAQDPEWARALGFDSVEEWDTAARRVAEKFEAAMEADAPTTGFELDFTAEIRQMRDREDRIAMYGSDAADGC